MPKKSKAADEFFWPRNFDVLASWIRCDTTQAMLGWIEDEHLNNAIRAEEELDLNKRVYWRAAARVYLDILKTLKSIEKRERAHQECRAQQARALEAHQQTTMG